MNNRITYYKMKSPYEGDITKNCALTGPEVDNNFLTLEGRDVASISVEDSDIVLNLLNGNKLKAKDALDNFIVNVSFDEENGILRIYRNNGDVEEISGIVSSFTVNNDSLTKVASDETLKGDGTCYRPLSIAENHRTGQFKPVKEIIENNPKKGCVNKPVKDLSVGDRFITSEMISPYGLLYDFNAVNHIACELRDSHSEWHIPSKEEWDDMLNAVEPCECDKNHSSGMPNKYLGKWAGKLLKTKDFWKTSSICHCEGEDENECHCGKGKTCKPSFCGEYDSCHFKSDKDFTKGIDKYGFSVVPAGYGDDGKNLLFFGERASFWTGTNIHHTNVFVKRFEYNKNTVYQDVIAGQNHLSLRLVKTYTGDNYRENENILGQNYPTVLMPSTKRGKSIWTAINVYYTSKNCRHLVPNNGHDMSLIKKYFIDEWNGHKWLRTELNEGDSVVVKNAPNDQTNVEYRIVNGKLISVLELVKEQVINETSNTINELEDKINDAIKNINDSLDKKVDWTDIEDERKAIVLNNNDAILGTDTKGKTHNLLTISNQDNIDYGSKELNLNLNSNDRPTINDTENIAYVSDVENIDAEQKEAIEKLDKKLDEEVESLTSANNELKAELNEEISNRENKDSEIEGKLLDAENTTFDAELGILELKSKDGSNDIKIQLTFNFGQF